MMNDDVTAPPGCVAGRIEGPPFVAPRGRFPGVQGRKMTSGHSHRRAFLAAALASSLAGPAHAASRYWSNAAGGLFADPANWSTNVVPGTYDNAIFDLPAFDSYTVNLRTDYSNYCLIVRTAPVILRLVGTRLVKYSLTSKSAYYQSVIVGELSQDDGQLTLTAGTLSGQSSVIASAADAFGKLTVSGPDSLFENASTLIVGLAGSGTLDVLKGARVTSVYGRLAAQPLSDATVTVDGGNSSWTLSGSLTVGEAGSAFLTVSNNGFVRSDTLVLANDDFGSMAVESAGTFQTTSMTLGNGPYGVADLVVRSGALVNCDNATLAVQDGANALAAVEGSGSAWTLSGPLNIASGGSAVVEVRNGAKLAAASLEIATLSTSDGSLAVSGQGSQATFTGGVTIGRGGTADLAVAAGATLANASATLGLGSDASGSAAVFGNGSRWTMTSQLIIASAGTGTLDITDGGCASNASAVIGQELDSDGAVTVADPGSSWTIASQLTVGQSGFATLDIRDGGTVSNGLALVGAGPNGSGTIDITGAASSWNCSTLYLGGDSLGPQGAGQVSVSSAAQLNVIDGIQIWSTGRLIISEGTVNASAINLAGGSISGAGTLAPPLAVANGQIDVGPSSALVLSGPLNTAAASTLHKTGRGTLQISGPQTHAQGSSLSIEAGAVDFDTDPGSPAAPNLTINLSDNAAANLNASAHLAALNLTGSARASLSDGADKLLYTRALSLDSQSTLDLADNDMVAQADSSSRGDVLYNVTAWVKSARNSKTTLWIGPGITCSAARNDSRSLTGLAVALNDKGSDQGPLFPIFDGHQADGNCILVKYTWNGDANLDGIVNADDYFLIDSGFITQGKGYYHGDFNYDGIVNADDYFLIDSAFLGQTASLALTTPGAHSPPSVGSPIPEPAALSLLFFSLAAAFPRRRRASAPR